MPSIAIFTSNLPLFLSLEKKKYKISQPERIGEEARPRSILRIVPDNRDINTNFPSSFPPLRRSNNSTSHSKTRREKKERKKRKLEEEFLCHANRSKSGERCNEKIRLFEERASEGSRRPKGIKNRSLLNPSTRWWCTIRDRGSPTTESHVQYPEVSTMVSITGGSGPR